MCLQALILNAQAQDEILCSLFFHFLMVSKVELFVLNEVESFSFYSLIAADSLTKNNKGAGMKRLALGIWTVFFLGMLTYSGFFLFQRDKLAVVYGWIDFPIILTALLAVIVCLSAFSLLICHLLGRRESPQAVLISSIVTSLLTSLVMLAGIGLYVLCAYQLWIILAFDLIFIILMFLQIPEEA